MALKKRNLGWFLAGSGSDWLERCESCMRTLESAPGGVEFTMTVRELRVLERDTEPDDGAGATRETVILYPLVLL